MTRQSTFKGRVRERMGKTGESYTAARRQLLDRPHETRREPPEAIAQRISDEALAEATGRHYEGWFELLDGWGAQERRHGEMARWLVDEQGVPGWWAQTVTVAYEQARGLRLPGQQPDGTFDASATKTVGVPVERLFEAFADEELRARWLPGDSLRVGSVQPGRSLRGGWEGSSSRVVAASRARARPRARSRCCTSASPTPTRRRR